MFEEIIDRSELLFRMKLMKDKIDAFESGEKYLRMKESHRRARQADARYIKGENVFDALTERFNQGLEAWGY